MHHFNIFNIILMYNMHNMENIYPICSKLLLNSAKFIVFILWPYKLYQFQQLLEDLPYIMEKLSHLNNFFNKLGSVVDKNWIIDNDK